MILQDLKYLAFYICHNISYKISFCDLDGIKELLIFFIFGFNIMEIKIAALKGLRRKLQNSYVKIKPSYSKFY